MSDEAIGKTYQQTRSAVSSQKGDVNILAQQVNIEAAKEQSTRDYKYEMKQKSLILAVNVPVVSAVQSVVDFWRKLPNCSSEAVIDAPKVTKDMLKVN